MTSFLVEAYTPPTIRISDVEARARRAADELAQAGTDVLYVRAIYVPEDELCFTSSTPPPSKPPPISSSEPESRQTESWRQHHEMRPIDD